MRAFRDVRSALLASPLITGTRISSLALMTLALPPRFSRSAAQDAPQAETRIGVRRSLGLGSSASVILVAKSIFALDLQ
jgi:hypothetical protein